MTLRPVGAPGGAGLMGGNTMPLDRDLFLPVSRADMARRGWDSYDFLLITGDAYVDHPSFGPAIIGRILEAAG